MPGAVHVQSKFIKSCLFTSFKAGMELITRQYPSWTLASCGILVMVGIHVPITELKH